MVSGLLFWKVPEDAQFSEYERTAERQLLLPIDDNYIAPSLMA